MLKTYPDETAYKAAEKSKIESAVSLIESTGRAVFDGVNVITENPGVGDIVCYDENRKIKFIQLDTFQAGTFPSAWETVGVVVLRKGNRVTVCSKHNETHKFMAVYPYVVTGYELDGAEHTVQLRLHGKPTSTTYYDFTYSATTDGEFVSQLQQFLETNGETGWSAYINGEEVWLQYNNYNDVEEQKKTKSPELSIVPRVSVDTSYTSHLKRKCGVDGYAVYCQERAGESLYKDINNTASNPDKQVTTIPVHGICWPAFAGKSQYRDQDYCLWLRQQYCKDPDNPTVEEWRKYIGSLQPVMPAMLGNNAPEYRSGKRQTDRVRIIRYKNVEGNIRPLYEAADYCIRFMDGKGYLPSVYEFILAFSGITYGLSGVGRQDSDPINRSLYAIGGNGISSNGNYWLGNLYSDVIQWHVSGYGIVDAYNSFYIRKTAIPFADIDLSELTD